MPSYIVTGTVMAGTFIGEIEADSAEHAVKKAWAQAHVSVCHQCADNVSDPDVVAIVATNQNDANDTWEESEID